MSKWGKPKDQIVTNQSGVSVRFDENDGKIQGGIEIHFLDADGGGIGPPSVYEYDDLTSSQKNLIVDLFESIRTKTTTDTGLDRRPPDVNGG